MLLNSSVLQPFLTNTLWAIFYQSISQINIYTRFHIFSSRTSLLLWIPSMAQTAKCCTLFRQNKHISSNHAHNNYSSIFLVAQCVYMNCTYKYTSKKVHQFTGSYSVRGSSSCDVQFEKKDAMTLCEYVTSIFQSCNMTLIRWPVVFAFILCQTFEISLARVWRPHCYMLYGSFYCTSTVFNNNGCVLLRRKKRGAQHSRIHINDIPNIELNFVSLCSIRTFVAYNICDSNVSRSFPHTAIWCALEFWISSWFRLYLSYVSHISSRCEYFRSKLNTYFFIVK